MPNLQRHYQRHAVYERIGAMICLLTEVEGCFCGSCTQLREALAQPVAWVSPPTPSQRPIFTRTTLRDVLKLWWQFGPLHERYQGEHR